jgi:O-antigen ligase/Tfp pilus assembly protein PilF
MNPERGLVWAASGLAVVATLLIGAVHPWTQVALSAAMLVLVAVFLVARRERGVRLVPFALLGAAAVAWTFFQLLPLPQQLVRLLSPLAWEARADLSATPAAWMPLTLDVPATLLETVKGLACLGLLLVLGTLARPQQRSHRALVPVALVGASLAALALVQRVAGSHTILGLYTPRSDPGSGVFGTLVNSNHAASLFTLSALVSVGLALEWEGGRRFVFGWAAVLSLLGLLSTASRGGAIGMLAGGSLFAALYGARRFGVARGLIGALLLAALVGGGTLWIGDTLRSRLVPQSAHELWSNAKVRGWRDGARTARHYLWTGVGRGAFEAPAAQFRDHDEGVRLVYPENVVVQLASEWGLPAALLLMGAVALALWRLGQRAAKLEASALAGWCAVIGVLVHELADFGLEMPGVALPAMVVLAVVVARAGDKAARTESEERLPRVPPWALAAALALWVAALGGGAWAAGHTFDADAQRLERALKSQAADLPAQIEAAGARHPASDHFALLAAAQELRTWNTESAARAMHQLNRALRRHPANGQAHRLAARTLAKLGRGSQAALEYRLAAERGLPATLDEILRVVGDRALDAVPQRPADQLELAKQLAGRGRAKGADAAARRAVELANDDEHTQLLRLQIALATGDKAIILSAAEGPLLAEKPSAAAFAQAAAAFEKVGDRKHTDMALERGLITHTDDGPLVLSAATLYLERGALEAARAVLKQHASRLRSLADRKAGEELLATIADKSGDVDGAVMARARARLLARQLKVNAVPVENP